MVKSVCVRFYLDKPLHRKAYESLQSQSESKSRIIITAINDYFDNQERENRLVEKIASRLSGFAISPSVSEKTQETIDEAVSAEIECHSNIYKRLGE